MKYQQPYGAAVDAPYVNGNPSTGVQGSIPPAAAFEQPQRELVALLSGSGVTPSDVDLTQVSRAVRSQRLNWLTAAGTSNAITLAPSPAFAAMVDLVGVPLRFLATAANTGAVTLNVNGLGAVALTWPDGTALAAGDLATGWIAQAFYDGAAFRLFDALSPAQVRAIARVDTTASTVKAPKLVTIEANQAAGVSVPTSTDTLMTFGATITNTLGTSTWSGSRLTIGAGEGGYWDISGVWYFAATANGVFAAARIKKNGTIFAAEYDQPTSVASTAYMVGCRATLKLVPGDYVEFYAYHQNGSTITATADTTYNRTRLIAQLISAY